MSKVIGKLKKGFKNQKKDKNMSQQSQFEEPFLDDQDRGPPTPEKGSNNGQKGKLASGVGARNIGSTAGSSESGAPPENPEAGGKVKQARFNDPKQIQPIGEDEQFEGVEEEGLPNDEPNEQDGKHLQEMFKKKQKSRRIGVTKEGVEQIITKYDLQGGTVVFAVSLAAYIFVVLAGLMVFKVHILKTTFYSFVYFLVGAGATYMYYRRKNFRNENKQKINLTLGTKGLSAYYMHPPTWVRLSDREKCEWLNNILEQCWPYYDKAICDNIIATVGPTLDDYVFPPVKHLEIEQLRFGDSPIRFENVKDVSEDATSHIIEMEVRWKGDSKVILGIDTFGLGEIHPKITNITFVGTIRIILRPLIPVIPGFGAVIATFRRPPIIKYQLNFGKLGGSATASQIKPVIDNIIRDQLANLLVWPNRFITPILPEDITGDLDYLKVNTQGVMKVQLIKGIDLKKMDVSGSTDGYVEMFTQPENNTKSKVQRNTLNPTWDETFYHLIQEPTYQFLRLTVYDIDFVNISQLTKHGLNIFKGVTESINAKEFLGRTSINLAEVCKYPGIPYERYFPLGNLDWSNPDGCGTGLGQVQLRLTYSKIQDNDPSRGKQGALIIHIRKGFVPKAAEDNDDDIPNPYIRFECHKKKFQTSVQAGKEVKWDQKFTWFQVDNSDKLDINLMDDTGLMDDSLGKLTIPIQDIIKCQGKDRNDNRVRGQMEQQLEIGQGNKLDIKINYMSYY